MTTTQASSVSTTSVSESLLRAMLTDIARVHRPGVVGVRARTEWTGGQRSFVHDGRPVEVALCGSTLAVHAAVRAARPEGDWLIVVTDRDASDLGLGLVSRFVGRRLRPADAWQVVQTAFHSTQVDRRLLVGADGGRGLAAGLLHAGNGEPWPAAPAGVLTADHVFSTVARRLGIGTAPTGPAAVPDRDALLRWTTDPGARSAVADLRSLAGDALVAPTLDWLADLGGSVRSCWRALLGQDRSAELVPIGLVLPAVLATTPGSVARALLRREVGELPDDAALAVWAAAAEQVVLQLVSSDPPLAGRLLRAADEVLDRFEVGDHAEASRLLERSLDRRARALGAVLRGATGGAEGRARELGVDAVLVSPADLVTVETRWTNLLEHLLLAERSELRAPAEAAVRLTRWLSVESEGVATVERHRTTDAWVDRAVTAAWRGVGGLSGTSGGSLGDGIGAVLVAVRVRRDEHDRTFAATIATAGGSVDESGVVPIERLLADHVLRLPQPLLLIVADGMSAANAARIVEDLGRRPEGWVEYVDHAAGRRLSAVTALPSITTVSRTALLTGILGRGEQDRERRGFAALCATVGVTGVLFHKGELDRSDAGHLLAHSVADAVDDPGVHVVTCVLNTIDDALDRSDPDGMDWTVDSVRHLAPLLERARRAGRVVVLTSDHGHIVERRQSEQRSGLRGEGNRWRPADGPPVQAGEVLVRGARVDGGSAVLAVDERLRYGPLKAGYHGGAAPAEVVVPVALLGAGGVPASWDSAPEPSPSWWHRAGVVLPTMTPAEPIVLQASRDDTRPTLFDEVPPAVSAQPDRDLADAVIASPQYAAQHFPTRAVTDTAIATLLRSLIAAPGGELDEARVAALLGVALPRLAGALGHAQRLLNVEQYPVLSRDVERRRVVLDVDLLRQQFGLDR